MYCREAVAGVVTCNQCVGVLSLNSELETCNHLFHSRKTKPKNIYSLPETGKGSRGIFRRVIMNVIQL